MTATTNAMTEMLQNAIQEAAQEMAQQMFAEMLKECGIPNAPKKPKAEKLEMPQSELEKLPRNAPKPSKKQSKRQMPFEIVQSTSKNNPKMLAKRTLTRSQVEDLYNLKVIGKPSEIFDMRKLDENGNPTGERGFLYLKWDKKPTDATLEKLRKSVFVWKKGMQAWQFRACK